MKKEIANTPASLKATYGLGLLCLTLLGMSSLQAQSISPQTLNIAGGYSQVGGYSLGYSLGEESSITYYTTATASTLSAGFLQDFGFLERDHLVLDLSLSNASFEGSTTQFFIPVGAFSVKTSRTTTSTKAPLFTSLYGPGYDNPYFYIKDNTLFWNSADPAPGKETFLILAQAISAKFLDMLLLLRGGERLERRDQRAYPEAGGERIFVLAYGGPQVSHRPKAFRCFDVGLSV